MPLPRKQARDLTFPLFAGDGPANAETMVRINPLSTPDGLKDILALRGCAAPPRALMLAKPGSAAEIRLYDELLQGSCADIRFHVIIRSTDGLANVMGADASSRIDYYFSAPSICRRICAPPKRGRLCCMRVRALFTQRRGTISICWMSLSQS